MIKRVNYQYISIISGLILEIILINRYLYNPILYEKNFAIVSLINCVVTCGNIAYDLCRYSPYLREDDYNISVFSFLKNYCI